MRNLIFKEVHEKPIYREDYVKKGDFDSLQI